MKKSIICGLSLAILVIGLSSCGKTTKGKITNDWTIVSSEEVQTTHSGQTGQEVYSKATMTENSVSNYSSYTLGGVENTSSNTGVVKANTISIKKDGTWNWTQELSYDENVGGGNTQNLTNKTNQGGTWSFVGKTKGDDFKKNERVIFNVLTKSTSTVQTMNQSVVTENSESFTYLAGENTMIFTVKESKNKELQLEKELDRENSSSGSSGVNTESKTLKMTLKGK